MPFSIFRLYLILFYLIHHSFIVTVSLHMHPVLPVTAVFNFVFCHPGSGIFSPLNHDSSNPRRYHQINLDPLISLLSFTTPCSNRAGLRGSIESPVTGTVVWRFIERPHTWSSDLIICYPLIFHTKRLWTSIITICNWQEQYFITNAIQRWGGSHLSGCEECKMPTSTNVQVEFELAEKCSKSYPFINKHWNLGYRGRFVFISPSTSLNPPRWSSTLLLRKLQVKLNKVPANAGNDLDGALMKWWLRSERMRFESKSSTCMPGRSVARIGFGGCGTPKSGPF